ncbi:MAG: ABC transporter ATP-binding protein/permease [Lachnospiraceae bacterium]|nr:ABC transporter ATP-binding protein/permease [Lachnospiraceae bacterium]
MKRLLIYLRDYKKESVLGPLFKMIEALLELFVPLVMAAIINTGVANGDKSYIVKMGALLVFIALLGLTVSVIAQFFAAKAACGFAAKLREALYEHIQSLSFSEIDTIGTSTMITRMTSDVNQLQNGVNMTLRLFLRSPFVVFGAMIMAFYVNSKVALWFVAAILLLSAVVYGVMAFTIPGYKKVQKKLDHLLLLTRENIQGVRVIRAFGREEKERETFRTENEVYTELELFVGKISVIASPITFIIVNLITLGIIYSGALQVEEGILLKGDVVALVNYMAQILVELVKFANLLVTINKALACADRVADVLDTTGSMEEGTATMNGQEDATQKSGQDAGGDRNEVAKVEFLGACLRYKESAEDSLEEISFSVLPGETIGIIGGTGSGKTSLVHMIPRFYDARKGEVFVDGKNVKDYELSTLRKKIGIVLQKTVLFEGTLRDNLLFANENATDDDMYEALTLAQAMEIVREKGKGLDMPIIAAGKNLSGGQRQRISIARALVRKPEILILDDSASALDMYTDKMLRNALSTLTDTTVFIVSQRVASVKGADRIVVMHEGQIAGIGTHTELLEHCEIYREIYDSQYPKEVEA